MEEAEGEERRWIRKTIYKQGEGGQRVAEQLVRLRGTEEERKHGKRGQE